MPWRTMAFCLAVLLANACGGGGGVGEARDAERRAQQGGTGTPGDDTTAGSDCSGFCADTPTALSAGAVERIIAQAVAEAEARNAPATIAVVDRVGNVLAVYRMDGAPRQVTITSTERAGGAPVTGGLEGLNFIPSELAAIAKAVTGAYLSTEGNAFTTRTASQIVQENFNPREINQPSGPLFGVQFSQLPCGDFIRRFVPGAAPGPGPHRSPLGLSADAGGLPLYKRGTVVGGIGVMSDGVYDLDKTSPLSCSGTDCFDFKVDEIIAVAGMFGFAPNPDRRAKVTVVGKELRFVDSFETQLLTDPEVAAPFAGLSGSLVAVRGYYDGGQVLAGTAFGHPESGIRPAAPGAYVDADGNDVDAFVFVDPGDANRHPPTAATDAPGGDPANALTADEVRQLIARGLALANRTRAQIRRPVGTPARVTISVVDSNGAILGMARTRDGPVFGADVSLQKARTAAFFSGTGRADGQAPGTLLAALPATRYLAAIEDPESFVDGPDADLVQALLAAIGGLPVPLPGDYVGALQTFTGRPGLLAAGGEPLAMTNRALGNLARPFYPDGVEAGPPGPLSKPRGEWSIFSTGLQLDLVHNAVIHHVAHILLPDAVGTDVGDGCTGNTGLLADDLFEVRGAISGLTNGMQIFPGSVPIYRGDVLVGGFGVSGDGVEQDDMIAFLATHEAGALGTALGNAPRTIRADRVEIEPDGERLRYVNCPQAPFIDSDEGGVCERADGSGS